MGMSASQARLLSITSRLTNNEFRAQTITNSKLRLATESEEASRKYMDALESKKLMYGVFDENGDRTYTNLTANVLLSYGDLKNQYSLVNSTGQIMLNGSDIKKYQKADGDLNTFLSSYGIALVENPAYDEALKNIFGKHTEYYNTGLYDKFEQIKKYIPDFINNAGVNDTLESLLNDNFPGIYTNTNLNYEGGIFEEVIKILRKNQDAAPKQILKMDQINITGTSPLTTETQHYYPIEDFGDGYDLNKMEYILARYIKNNSTTGVEATFDSGTVQLQKSSTLLGSSAHWGFTNFGCELESTDSEVPKIREILNQSQNAELKNDIVKLYLKLLRAIEDKDTSDTILVDANFTNYEEIPKVSLDEIKDEYQKILPKLSNAVLDYVSSNTVTGLTEDFRNRIESCNTLKTTAISMIENLQKYIEKLPDEKIPDTTDARYQWYLNLWERMGAGKKDAAGNLDMTGFKELDENLINNAEWLQFALKHGILTIEQAQFVEDGSVLYPNMGTFDWVAKPYTNATDIVSRDDEVAIAIAEVKYKKEIKEIENQDKKYDQDLKKLDTEHTALQTEHDSIKEVISKHTERSFKAFS